MTDPVIAISWGELYDRLTILDIKRKRLTSESARGLADAQYTNLSAALTPDDPVSSELARLSAQLTAVNERLWTLEDEIRAHESRKDFGDRFVELARGVYLNNDERTRLKREIDRLLGSESEPKEYTPYEAAARKPGT